MSSHSAGLRRSSPKTFSAEKFARTYREGKAPAVTRTAALQVAKRSAAAMGLKAAKLALIDQLFAASKSVDWSTPGRPPIVWPSNARLARSLGLSISTMKYHLKGLVEAGLVAYSDHPTYQRRGRRDAEGNIVEAYGIDLSPIATRFAELHQLAENAEYEAREWRRLSYRRTIMRKEIQSLIVTAGEEYLPGPWTQLQARLDVLREHRATDLDDLMAQVSALEGLREEVENLFDKGFKDRNFDATVSKFRPVLTTAEPSDSESGNHESSRANARHPNPFAAFGRATEKKSDGVPRPPQSSKTAAQVLNDDAQMISLPLVQAACPAVREFAPDAFTDWRAFRASGQVLCAAAGINPQVLQEAQAILGPDLAASALAITVQRSNSGAVAKPGAYLRTLVQRGRDGELHLSRSLFALAKAGEPPTGLSAVAAPVSVTPTFPASGSIAYSAWAEAVREYAPKPTPDVDSVANAFRRWARDKNLDLTAPNIERVFAGFCRKWRMN
ncbi:replication protein C (plasmid) [Afipia carboxidovorans OM5]|uniref:Replication protein C n=1 Tax=Afipia carboxidovorans (strain ATCC 49405 / DSM 1227 / KCTC 32145 / OM5) TaxID=504832 RepID=F8C0W8_AFIC5|nr:plasmid replication protein RepC [Afipia carboxidovorans]AEI04450.1 replication protein C [Afipia carboxidovorans OM4]AEI08078.1 replication protein C [Afipia carboxidovorans OM5]